MSLIHRCFFVAVLLAPALWVSAAGPALARERPPQEASTGRLADAESDALPRGAVARFGTTRLRQFDVFATCLAYSPNGEVVAAACGKAVRRWDTASGKELPPAYKTEEEVRSFAFFPDGRKVAVSTTGEFRSGGRIVVVDFS